MRQKRERESEGDKKGKRESEGDKKGEREVMRQKGEEREWRRDLTWQQTSQSETDSLKRKQIFDGGGTEREGEAEMEIRREWGR